MMTPLGGLAMANAPQPVVADISHHCRRARGECRHLRGVCGLCLDFQCGGSAQPDLISAASSRVFLGRPGSVRLRHLRHQLLAADFQPAAHLPARWRANAPSGSVVANRLLPRHAGFLRGWNVRQHSAARRCDRASQPAAGIDRRSTALQLHHDPANGRWTLGPEEYADETDYSAAYEPATPRRKRSRINQRAIKKARKQAMEARLEQERIDQILAKVIRPRDAQPDLG